MGSQLGRNGMYNTPGCEQVVVSTSAWLILLSLVWDPVLLGPLPALAAEVTAGTPNAREDGPSRRQEGIQLADGRHEAPATQPSPTTLRASLGLARAARSAPGSACLVGRGSKRNPMMKEFHRKILKNRGIQDLSPASLTGLLCSQSVLLRYHSASLLGEEQERSAIPALEQLLTDQQPIVRLAATRALLRMDNRGGIPMLEAFCKRVAEEIKNGEYRNLSDGLSALRVLAEAQEASAIPLLRSLLGAPVFSDDYYYFVRLEVVRSLGRLMAKDPSVEVDIMQMLGDEHPVVSKEAALILKKVRAAEQ